MVAPTEKLIKIAGGSLPQKAGQKLLSPPLLECNIFQIGGYLTLIKIAGGSLPQSNLSDSL